MSELGQEARDLIERALREEASVEQSELVRIRRRVLATAAGASVFGSAGKVMAVLGKATLGPVVKAFGVGVAVTVLALGIPIVLSEDRPNARQSALPAEQVPAKAASPGHAATPSDSEGPLTATPSSVPEAVVPRDVRAPGASERRGSATSVAPVGSTPPHAAEVPAPHAKLEEVAPVVGTSAPESATAAFGIGTGTPESYSTPSGSGARRKSSPLVQELTLLEKVQSELRAGRGANALELLDSNTVPEGGQLQAERLAAEVFAACQAGDVSRARAAARRFLSRYPSSPASGRVRASCAGEEVGNAQ
ncbi:MAG: hypothetical protein ACOY0T_34400 [Myxococcota bacterium]